MSYESITRRVTAGSLRLISIVAPPRSSSTALERALSESASLHGQINEPWSQYDTRERRLLAYRALEERVRKLEGSADGRPVSAVVKNIADFIAPGAEWSEWLGLCDRQIFLVRNPILCIESLIKQIARSIAPDQTILEGESADASARRLGYESWAAMQERCNCLRNYRPYQEILSRYFPATELSHSLEPMRRAVLERAPARLFRARGHCGADSFARASGFGSWTEMRERCDLGSAPLAQLLDDAFACRITGWEALHQHVALTRELGRDYRVVDSSLFRAAPAEILQALCAWIGISYAPEMLEWRDETSRAFDKGYGSFAETPFYDRVLASRRIDPPLEEPLPLPRFPEFLSKHLSGAGGALEIYHELIADARAIPAAAHGARIVDGRFSGRRLSEIDPVLAGALASAVNAR